MLLSVVESCVGKISLYSDAVGMACAGIDIWVCIGMDADNHCTASTFGGLALP